MGLVKDNQERAFIFAVGGIILKNKRTVNSIPKVEGVFVFISEPEDLHGCLFEKTFERK